jgi:hypothetical protein
MNYNTTKLAEIQDICLDRIRNNQKLLDEHINYLRNDKWISLSRYLAPNNLVIRNDCILDIVDLKMKRKRATCVIKPSGWKRKLLAKKSKKVRKM